MAKSGRSSPPRRRAGAGWSIPLLRVWGIQIRMHASFLLLVALVAWAEAQPGGSGLGSGLFWLGIIFVCVLVHEMAHSLVARAKGAEVESITLLPIGGVSRLRRMPKGWAAELAVSAAGPLASLGIAAAAALAAVGARQHLVPIDIYHGAFAPRLAWINVLLGAFNLLPALPLDGGRVLKAILERRRSVEDATAVAAQLGRAFAVAMVIAGLFWNFWLVLIGGFVFLGAAEEERAARIHATLHGVSVADVMTRFPLVFDCHRRVGELQGLLPVRAQHDFPVTRDGFYEGLVDEDSLAGADPAGELGELADREAPVLAPGTDIGDVGLDELVESGYPSLPVVEGGVVVGLLSLEEVGRVLQRREWSRR